MGRDGQPVVTTGSTGLRTTLASISFDRSTPYANYNWELFLHTPLAIADYLASQQRFDDARLWLHAVFDPTTEKKTIERIRFHSFGGFCPSLMTPGLKQLPRYSRRSPIQTLSTRRTRLKSSVNSRRALRSEKRIRSCRPGRPDATSA